jgi:hypothetical protein
MKPYRFRVQFHGPLRGYRIDHGPRKDYLPYSLPPAMVRLDTLESAFMLCVAVANSKQLGSYFIRVDPPAVTFE